MFIETQQGIKKHMLQIQTAVVSQPNSTTQAMQKLF